VIAGVGEVQFVLFGSGFLSTGTSVVRRSLRLRPITAFPTGGVARLGEASAEVGLVPLVLAASNWV
jgi:hypothetical protein